MAFKLTLFLCVAIFVAMYFAPDRPEPLVELARDGDRTQAQSAPAAPVTPVPDAPAAPPDVAVIAPFAPSASPAPPPPPPPPPAPAATQEAVAEPDAPVTLPELGRLGLTAEGGEALALSQAVRDRSADAAQAATDTLLQGLVGNIQTAQPGVSPANAPQTSDLAQLADPVPQPTDPVPQPTDPVPPPATQSALVVGSFVNLRAGPSTDFDVVGQVDFGDTVGLTAPFEDGWASLVHPDTGDEVFMASRFLQIQP